MGKKEWGTLSPSESPSMFPSSFPSDMPSLRPSLAPTQAPTTPSPTSAPSSRPTETSSSSPTNGPTGAPTGQPTDVASQFPTWPPTQAEKDAGDYTVSSVRLPMLGIDLILSDSDAASPAVGDLDTELTSFMLDVLATNSGVDSFDYATLEFDVILSVFNRRRLDTGLSVKIDGTTYFGGEAPSEEDLTQSLLAYFSFWGIQDLEAYLQVTGLTSSRIAAVSVGGYPVKAVNQGGQAGAQVRPNKTISGSSLITPGIIAGIVAGFIFLVLTIVFAVSKTRKAQRPAGSRRRQRKNRGSNQKDSSDEARSGRIGATSSPQQSVQNRSTSDDESRSSDGISIDNSLYTTDTYLVQPRRPNPANSYYDAKRLDKVIATAKQHTAT
jgi:hypothetical protein